MYLQQGFVLMLLISISRNEELGSKNLKMVYVVYRHGARSPLRFFPSDSYQLDAWPDGTGRLTQNGMTQEYELGQFFRHRYIDSGFINSTYLHKEVYIRSSDVDRCLQSAQVQLAGLYPPSGYQVWNSEIPWQPVPVHTVPIPQDSVLRPADNCPKMQSLWNEKKTPDIYKSKQAEWKTLLQNVTKHAGYTVTLGNLGRITDTISCEKAEGWAQPAWVKKYWEQMSSLSDLKNSLMYTDTGDKLGQLLGGPFLSEMITSLTNLRDNNNAEAPYKLNIFSGHDTSLLAVSAGLDIQIDMPKFASCLLFEISESKSGYVAKIFYRNGNDSSLTPLRLKQCNYTCPLEDYITILSKRATKDRMAECGMESPWSSRRFHTISITLLAISVFLLTVVAVLCFRQRKGWLASCRLYEKQECSCEEEKTLL